jgi:hypothetical protein
MFRIERSGAIDRTAEPFQRSIGHLTPLFLSICSFSGCRLFAH